MKPILWADWGDINAFFGLMLDNVAVLLLLVTILSGPDGFSARFVIERIIPGTALGVFLGDLIYTALAVRLARRQGRSDVTAMPLGLDTPSTFAVAFLVLLPALKQGLQEHPGDRDLAMNFAWHVGATVLVIIGILKSIVAPVGNAVRRLVPRAGLLGSLAAIALALIAFMPLQEYIAAVPLVGFLSLTIILITLIAHRRLPGNFPGVLAAVLVGVAAFHLFRIWNLVPPLEGVQIKSDPLPPVPDHIWQSDWWQHVLLTSLEKLPVILPFGLATVVGGIDCTESAAAAGDEYDTRTILLTEGFASIAAGLFGGVIQNTPYIGHPAYKRMGGRCAYTLATALFIGMAGFFGWFTHIFEWLPQAALFPILVFVGVEITAVSFRVTPANHYPALALAMLPALAYLALIPLGAALGQRPPDPAGAATVQTLRCLGNGFIITCLLWGAALAALIDGRAFSATAYFVVAGLCSLVGIIHSPLPDGRIAWPEHVMAELKGAAPYQTPYHWAGAYTLAALLVIIVSLVPQPEETKAVE